MQIRYDYLTRASEFTSHETTDSFCNVSAIKNYKRRITAELHLQAFDSWCAMGQEYFADRRRASKRNLLDQIMLAQVFANWWCVGTRCGDHI